MEIRYNQKIQGRGVFTADAGRPVDGRRGPGIDVENDG